MIALPTPYPWSTAPYTVEKPYTVSRPKYSAPRGYDPCSCVSYARWRTGINVGSVGTASRHPVNSDVPRVGGLIILYDRQAGHAGAVENVNGEEITYSDCNEDYHCKCGKRTILLSDSKIKGFYYE